MAAVATGDTQAFDRLVRLHLDPIHGYLYRLTGSRPDAEDLAQETFLRLWRKAGSYQPGRVKVSTWLHTIAHRLCIDAFRRKRESPAKEGQEMSDELSDPARQLSARETQAQIQEAISKLPERQRAAIVLCQVQGFSNAQAAEILAVNNRALESLLARARRTLRKTLAASDTLEADQWD